MPLQLAEDRPPVPPADLVLRVAPSFDADDIASGLSAFDLHALDHLHCFERALALTGRTLTDFARLLDFGCGCGRFLRHLGPIANDVEIHGTDIDSEMIEWLNHNVAYGRYVVAPREPPLAYPDHHFDLIINHSVFSHLDERHQDLWLGELHRISSVDAVLLLTVEGTSSWNRLRKQSGEYNPSVLRWQRELESRGIVHIRDDFFIGSTHPDVYHSTFHAPWYIFEHWTRFFDLVAYLPDGSATQDLVVLRRRADGVQPQRAIRAWRVRTPKPSVDSVRSVRSMLRRIRGRLRSWRYLNPVTVGNELGMLRGGMYEQGKRISVIAAELRREIDSVRAMGGSGDSPRGESRP